MSLDRERWRRDVYESGNDVREVRLAEWAWEVAVEHADEQRALAKDAAATAAELVEVEPEPKVEQKLTRRERP